MQRRMLIGCLGLSLVEMGCAMLVEFPDDPEFVEPELSESELEPDVSGDWRCLSEAAAPAEPAGPTAHVMVQACDALRGCSLPLAGLRGRVCDKLDAACTSPFFSGATDEAGVLQFDVPTANGGFDGYLELTAPSVPCTNTEVFGEASPLLCGLLPACDPQAPDERCDLPTYARALRFFNPPIVADFLQPMRQSLLSSVAMPAIVRAAGGDFDPTKGNLVVTALDCSNEPAAGIGYALGERSGPSTPYYMDSGVLSADRNATDATGVGAFAGVAPGFADLDGYSAAGVRIGGVGVLVVPSAITYATLVPARPDEGAAAP